MNIFIFLFVYSLLMRAGVCAIGVVYLTSHCNTTVQAQSAGIVEPDSSLYYRGNQDCTVTLSTTHPQRILLRFYRFFLEEPVNGVCVDKLVVYDDAELTSPLTNELCGRLQVMDVASSGSNVSFVFQTDEDGSNSGFGIFYSVFTDAPCSETQFACNNSRCIDASLECDTYNMCGDGSDEANCDTGPVQVDTGLPMIAVIGIIMLTVFVIVLVYVIIKAIINSYKSRKLMKQLLKEMEKTSSDGDYNDTSFWKD